MFKVAKFDSTANTDNVCKELTSIAPKKNKVRAGKIAKRKLKPSDILKNEEKIKNEVKKILQNNVIPKIKKKPKKVSSPNKTESGDAKSPNSTTTAAKKRRRKKTRNKTKPETTDEKIENTNSVPTKKRKRRKSKTQNTETEQKEPNIQKTNTEKSPRKRRRPKRRNKANSSLEEKVLTPSKSNQNPKKHKIAENDSTPPKKKKKQDQTLREKMMSKLQASRFRYINEQIYTTDSKAAQKLFKEDPAAFQAYHQGYRQQVNKWPLNPLDAIIKTIHKLPKNCIIADFGCGDAKLAASVPQKVHSFDLVAVNDSVTACDMAHVPLTNESVDVAVFCLSLMGTNLQDYLLEANRVLKVGGIMKIAEVESRFDDISSFIEGVHRYNFKNTWKDVSHNLFYFLDFKKEANIKKKKKLPTISLNPCLYKKR